MAYDCKLIETYPGFGPELTTDGNMEDTPLAANHWTAGGGAGLAVSATVHGGCQSLEVTDGGAGTDYAYQDVTVEAGERYKIEVWGYSAAANDTWRVRIYADTGAGLAVKWTSDEHDVLAPVAWEKETTFYRIPNAVTTIRIWLQVTTATEIVLFDDVSVRRESPVPMTEIDLLFRATDDWAILDQGISINDPAIKELWGGELEDQLVRREEGKRVIPMELHLLSADADTLIDDVNGLEAMLRHAAAFRTEGKRSGYGETFLQFKTDNATHYVWYPVIAGRIDKRNLMKKCNSDQEIDNVPATIICEAYWESLFTYDLSNLLDNPGFEEWNNGICNSEPDCWTNYETAGAAGENQQETDTVEEGCEALRIELDTPAAGQYQGVTQDITARLRADTEYTLLVWVQNELIANGKIQVYPEGSNSGIVNLAIDEADAHAVYTLHSCQFTPDATDMAGGANWYEIRARIVDDGSGTCVGIAHIDKMLVMESSNVPTGWMSSSYLVNHYDRRPADAGHINYLSVCDVPGEVEAEVRYPIDLDNDTRYLRVAKRARNEPCNFIWELNAKDAYCETDAIFGLVAADTADSTKVVDPTAPGGHNITVDFDNQQLMVRRCAWSITNDLTSYFGAFVLLVVAKRQNATDTIKMNIRGNDEYSSIGGTKKRAISATSWTLYDGWEVLCFRVGASDDELFGAGNDWRIELWASTSGAAPGVTNLYIANAYLMAVDEAHAAGGYAALGTAPYQMILKNMDGDKGLFLYKPSTDTYYPNLGLVGPFPLLTPEVENWLYFITTTTNDVYVFDDTYHVSLRYRPRGIFLRGGDPA